MSEKHFLLQITDGQQVLHGVLLETDPDFSIFETALESAYEFLTSNKTYEDKIFVLTVEYGTADMLQYTDIENTTIFNKKSGVSHLIGDIATKNNVLYFSMWEGFIKTEGQESLHDIYSTTDEDGLYVYAELRHPTDFKTMLTRNELDREEHATTRFLEFLLESPLYEMEASFHGDGGVYDIAYNAKLADPYYQIAEEMHTQLTQQPSELYPDTLSFCLEVRAAPVGSYHQRWHVHNILKIQYSVYIDENAGGYMAVEQNGNMKPEYVDWISKAYYHPEEGWNYDLD